MNKFTILLTIYIFSRVYAKPIATESDDEEELEPALMLTPLINAGRIREARCRSAVPSFLNEGTPIRSNSGFLTVNATRNANLFFWFIQRTERWQEAPVVLWLNGGPGCSSMIGLFTENGPYVVTVDGVSRRLYSWSEYYNVLYIDSPVGSGFSFADTEDGYARRDIDVGRDLYAAIRQFYAMFPEIQANELYVAGQSYAGKYIPALAYVIDQANENAELAINLKGLFIGNGYTDPENMLGFADYLHKLGLVDYRTKKKLQDLEEQAIIFIRSGYYREADLVRDHIIKIVKQVTGYDSVYDYVHDPQECYRFGKFLQSTSTRNALHVGNRPYELCSSRVYENLKDEIMRSARPWIEQLLERYRIMFYNGQLDISVAHQLSTDFLEQLRWSGAGRFQEAKRVKWYVGDQLAGYYKRDGNLMQALVRDAGHAVLVSKPKFALDLFMKFVNDEL